MGEEYTILVYRSMWQRKKTVFPLYISLLLNFIILLQIKWFDCSFKGLSVESWYSQKVPDISYILKYFSSIHVANGKRGLENTKSQRVQNPPNVNKPFKILFSYILSMNQTHYLSWCWAVSSEYQRLAEFRLVADEEEACLAMNLLLSRGTVLCSFSVFPCLSAYTREAFLLSVPSY